ncbi:hypothetical protein EDD15DRAFT_2198483 [Pisolithus albus]|nr:hypothetical protein EDD15DRAFT_2198483 [Pisolithus albus]
MTSILSGEPLVYHWHFKHCSIRRAGHPTRLQLNDRDPQTRYDILSEATRLLRMLGEENASLKQRSSPPGGSVETSMDSPALSAHTECRLPTSKFALQREYRRKEGDVFNELRHTIRQLNDRDPQTRHDILSEATRLLRMLGEENASLKQRSSPPGGSVETSMDSPALSGHTECRLPTSKFALQLEYRRKEGDAFNELRHTIRQLNDRDPQTRHDILSEATRLLRLLGEANESLKQRSSPPGGSVETSMDSPALSAHTGTKAV